MSFLSYKTVETRPVQATSGVSRIVGEESIFLNIGKGITVHASQAPEINRNILVTHFLSEFFEELYSFTRRPKKVYFILEHDKLDNAHVVHKIPCKDELYALSTLKLPETSSADFPDILEYKKWH